MKTMQWSKWVVVVVAMALAVGLPGCTEEEEMCPADDAQAAPARNENATEFDEGCIPEDQARSGTGQGGGWNWPQLDGAAAKTIPPK